MLASAEYDYHYDAAGRLDKSLSTIAGLTKEIQQTHTRDPLGRRSGLAVDLVTGFDSSDWSVDTTVAEHANAYTFDHLGQLTRVTQSGGVSGDAGVAAKRVDLEYDAAGRITKVKRRDGLLDNNTIVAETTNTYGTSFLSASLLKIETTNSSSQVIARETYQYLDPFFRVTTHKTGVGSAEHTTSYQYDTTGQLISADDDATTGVEESFVWDLNGNRKNPGDVVPTANLLTTAGGIRYLYDDEGNLDEEQTASGNVLLRSFDWDYRQRLTKVTNYETGGQIDKTIEYVYDTFDRRVSSKVTDYTTNGSGVAVAGTPVVETYVYDEGAQSRGDVLLDFVDSDGPSGNAAAVSKRYLWGQAVDQLFAQEDVANQLLTDTDRYAWLLQDRLNTVREVLNRDGSVAAHIDYDSFGEIESVTDASGSPAALPTRFTFTGQELDSNTGMSFYSDGTGDGRWLSHAQNRFISRDAIPVGPGNRNLYAYVNNQPTGFIDPSGREIYDVPGAPSNTLPGTGNLAGVGPAAPRPSLGPKADLGAANQPNIALPSSIDASLEPLELDDGTDLSLEGEAMNEDTALVLELTETGFDVTGLVDPTPCCDAGGAVCAGARGDWKGASISVVGMIPYFGDLAKLGKLAKKVKMIERVIERCRESAAFAERARPLLEAISRAIGNSLHCLPDEIADPLRKLKDLLDDYLGKKIPNADLKAPPPARGRAPIGSDGHPIEGHHRDQLPDRPKDEMTRKDHRGGDNYKKNHSNTGQEPSKIDRKQWNQEREEYWEREWDAGRFDDFDKK